MDSPSHHPRPGVVVCLATDGEAHGGSEGLDELGVRDAGVHLAGPLGASWVVRGRASPRPTPVPVSGLCFRLPKYLQGARDEQSVALVSVKAGGWHSIPWQTNLLKIARTNGFTFTTFPEQCPQKSYALTLVLYKTQPRTISLQELPRFIFTPNTLVFHAGVTSAAAMGTLLTHPLPKTHPPHPLPD